MNGISSDRASKHTGNWTRSVLHIASICMPSCHDNSSAVFSFFVILATILPSGFHQIKAKGKGVRKSGNGTGKGSWDVVKAMYLSCDILQSFISGNTAKTVLADLHRRCGNVSQLFKSESHKYGERCTFTSDHSVQHSQSDQFTHFKDIEAKPWIANHRTRAPLRRVLLFQMLAVFGTIFCGDPILVDGLAKANEKRSNMPSDRSEFPSDGIVLHGFPYTAKLEKPSTSPQILQVDYMLEEVLSVKLKLLRSKASAFHIFINLPSANEQTPVTIPEFGGSYFHEPRRVKSPDFEFQVVTYRIGIGEIIKDLGLGDKSSILVTFVPCGADKGLPIVLEQIEVELE